MRKLSILLPLVIVLVIIGTGLYILSRREKETEDDGKIKIAASTMVVADIVRNIAGENIEVVQIMPNGADPHNFEPSVEDKSRVADADVMFVIGHGFDNWAKNLAEPDTKIVELDRNLALLFKEDSHEGESGRDPHYWLAVSNAHIMSGTIRDELVILDPGNEVTYRANYEKYTQRLADLKTEMTKLLSDLKTRKIITFHEAFAYFALDFNLEIVATIEPNSGQEPSPEDLAQIGDVIEENNIKVLFKEPQINESIVITLAEDYDVEIATLDPEGGVEDVDTYEELIQFNAVSLREALD